MHVKYNSTVFPLFSGFKFYPHLASFVIAYVLCSSEKHYLHFKFTVLSKANTFPEFRAEAVADGRRIVYYNNKDKSWVRSSHTDSPPEPPESRDWFIHQMKTLSNCSDSQCSGEFHAFLIHYQTCCETAYSCVKLL